MAVSGFSLFNILVFMTSSITTEKDFRYISYEDLTIKRFFDEDFTFYSQILFDVARNQVLIGARDALFRLSLSQLKLLEKTLWSAQTDKIAWCSAKGQTEQNCHNFIKVLLINGNKVFTCGTNAFSPICSWREIENLSNVLEWVDGIAKCPYNPSANITAFILDNGHYYVGGPTDFHGSDAAIYRTINRHNTIRTKQYNSMWLNEPQFVGSFETDQFVFFVFREAAVEYINCGKIVYSRIARVCKNDSGGQLMLKDNWTTFLKARLNCSISGDYPFYFDEIQSITYVAEKQLLYAAFTTPSNSIAGSAICAFNISSIETAFQGPFKYQQHIRSSWDKHYSQHQNHFTCKSSPLQDKDETEISKYQLMDNAVQSTSLSPLYVAELERFTYITVDILPTKLHSSVHVIYVSTLAGLIKKLVVFPDISETCVVEIWEPISNVKTPILNLQYLKETDSVYIGTNTELLSVSAHNCKRHVSRDSCHNSMDPYCGWNELEDSCTTAPNADPSTKYWIQSLTSCPIENAPVDGAWTAWSEWSPCQLRNAQNFDSIDECLCQMRQCNNPAPQNGGKECNGLGVAVINCTVHGGWTPWSAWSACSATCGIAVKTRRRTCSNPTPAHGGRVCVGQDHAEVLCAENPPCPVEILPPHDGKWSEWKNWTACSAPCGGGIRKRQRKCDSPAPKHGGHDCIGCDTEYEICNAHICQEQKRHGTWTPWFKINGSNNDYIERRYRYTCRGPVHDIQQLKISLYKEEERICKDGLCSSSSTENISKSSTWSSWSECSSSCGDGVQLRTRICEGRGECHGASVQTKKCNLQACKSVWGCWDDWLPCTVSCGVGTRKRYRKCLGEHCNGESFQVEPCEKPSCSSLLGWGNWTAWSICDENNEQHRQRKCHTSNPGPHLCQGLSRESRICISDVLNAFTALDVEMDTSYASTKVVIGCVSAAIVACLLGMIVMLHLYFKRRKPRIPCSPHYISAKQNPYITVPLQELPVKREGASTSNSMLNNSHNGTLKSNKCYDYDIPMIKRNSHSLNNGHMKTDNFYYD